MSARVAPPTLLRPSFASHMRAAPSTIADRVGALWAYANKSGPVVVTQIIVIVFARNDRASGWEYLFYALNDVLTEGCYVYLESSVDLGETASVCLWIAEETQ